MGNDEGLRGIFGARRNAVDKMNEDDLDEGLVRVYHMSIMEKSNPHGFAGTRGQRNPQPLMTLVDGCEN